MRFAVRVLVALLALAGAQAAAAQTAVQPRIANGVGTAAWPAVGMLVTNAGTCTATLIGCRTMVTAAHCLCSSLNPPTGTACGGGETAPAPEDVLAFLPQAGILAVETIRIAPGYTFAEQDDAALLELRAPLRGIRPRRINEVQRPPVGTAGTIVGYGATQEGADDSGLLRQGAVTTASCSTIFPGSSGALARANHVCWAFASPVGAPGTDSNTCAGDSGGPLFATLGDGTKLVGIHSGGSLASCDLSPADSFDTDVYVVRGWLRGETGVELDDAACGDGPQVGDETVTTLSFAGAASLGQQFHDFAIPPGTRRLRVGLAREDHLPTDVDLYVRVGMRPTTSEYDCASRETFLPFEYCEIPDPAPGTGHVLVARGGDVVDYQVTVTLLPEDPAPPRLVPGALVVASFASDELFRVDPATGRRAVLASGLRGAGAALAAPESVARNASGALVVANAFGRNLVRVNPSSGDRTVVSGCVDAACAATIGTGPAFLAPRFVARDPDGGWLVADRSVPGLWALVRVSAATGDRTVLSGCGDPGCAQPVGAGPEIGRLYGLVVEPGDESLAVADGQAVLRIDLASGDRTILSGCTDAACSGLVGSGPGFGEPVDLVVEDGGALLVSYRIDGSPFGAIRRVDPATGARTLVSGCEDAGCTTLRGAGPAFLDLFGLALDAGQTLYASDSGIDAVFRVDLDTGDRVLVSGCADEDCSTRTGDGPRLGEAVDLLVVPEPGAGTGAVALAALGLVAARRRPGAGPRRTGLC